MARRLLALFVFAILATGQTSRIPLSSIEAARLEEAVQANAADRVARGMLLEYYFRTAAPAQATPARRRHILWLIENAPGDSLAGGPSATIDAAGHKLADAEGFKLASDAWRRQTAKSDLSVQALANAAYFFKLSDLGFAQSLLERAVAIEPSNKEFGARLGDLYAMGILGITMMNGNGYPLAASVAKAQSPIGQRSREALNNSRNPYVLAKGGYMLSFQGAILRGSGKLGFNPVPLAESSLQRAVSLAPADSEVAAMLQQHRDIQRAAH